MAQRGSMFAISTESVEMKPSLMVATIRSWSEQYLSFEIVARDTQSLKCATRVCPLLVNDFPKQETDSKPLPVKSKLRALLANMFTFRTTTISNPCDKKERR